MSNIPKIKRFPNLGKLSISILEHAIKPILGENAINEIKSPVVEKELLNSLEEALERTEKRFIAEYTDQAICEAVLSLPLSDLPTVVKAVRNFYIRPNDSTLSEVLSEQISVIFHNLASERIENGVSVYLKFLQNELINLNDEIRGKLSAHATLEIQENTTRIANTLTRLEQSLIENTTLKPKTSTKPRISWRDIETYLHPVSSDSEETRAAYLFELANCLHKTFSSVGYIKFVGLLRLSELSNGNQKYKLYELICHQIEFCAMARKMQNYWIDVVQEIKKNGVDNQGRTWEQIRREVIKEDEDFEKEWTLPKNLLMSNSFLPIEFIYDPSARRISIETIQNLSYNVDHYPNGVSTTSEALKYISAMANLRVGVFDDILDIEKQNRSLLKLIFAARDNSFTFENFQINSDDYEQWDYINPAFDKRQRKTFPNREAG